MTVENLEIATKNLAEINKLKEFRTAFNNGLSNTLIAVDYVGSTQCDATLAIDSYDNRQLHDIINYYLKKRIKQLEEEFDNL